MLNHFSSICYEIEITKKRNKKKNKQKKKKIKKKKQPKTKRKNKVKRKCSILLSQTIIKKSGKV